MKYFVYGIVTIIMAALVNIVVLTKVHAQTATTTMSPTPTTSTTVPSGAPATGHGN